MLLYAYDDAMKARLAAGEFRLTGVKRPKSRPWETNFTFESRATGERMLLFVNEAEIDSPGTPLFGAALTSAILYAVTGGRGFVQPAHVVRSMSMTTPDGAQVNVRGTR